MLIDISNTVEKFQSFIRSLENSSERKLVSFAFKLEDFEVISSLDSLNSIFNDVFLFHSPDSKYSFLTLNTAFNMSNNKQCRITEAVIGYEQMKSCFINNWDELHTDIFPIICTAIKFDALKKSNDWNDFEPINFFIPELAFYTNNENRFGCYNFIHDKTIQSNHIQNRFLSQLTFIKEIASEKKSGQENYNEYESLENKNEMSLWLKTSGKAIDMLSNANIQKLVVSRSHKFTVRNSLNYGELLKKLSYRFPDCYLFYLKKNDSHFFGSSPELFLKIFGKLAEVESVAGSAPRGKRFESDEKLEHYLQSSTKNHKEHKYVTEFISDILKNHSDKVFIKEEKSIKKLDNIQHLATKISAELKSNVQLLDIIDALFPTPAVCGLPKDEAMLILRKLEAHDRGLYSGLIGWMDFEGNCELAVAIRSTLVKNNLLTAYAGAGLVEDSNPEEEFIETKLKLDPILSLFKSQKHISGNEDKN